MFNSIVNNFEACVTLSLKLLFAAAITLIPGCKQTRLNAENPTPEICNRYSDQDKINWCMGDCEKVVRDDYRELCLLTIEKRTPSLFGKK